jgi:hypothetical protein
MQRPAPPGCQNQKTPMHRLFTFLCAVTVLLAVASCSKSNNNSNTLQGVWVNENLPNDTLRFVQKFGKNILQVNMSFNPALPTYTEYEYKFVDGKLWVALAPTASPDHPIDSFTWIDQGKKFEILGFQLYLFMSSSTTHFRYHKVS